MYSCEKCRLILREQQIREENTDIRTENATRTQWKRSWIFWSRRWIVVWTHRCERMRMIVLRDTLVFVWRKNTSNLLLRKLIDSLLTRWASRFDDHVDGYYRLVNHWYDLADDECTCLASLHHRLAQRSVRIWPGREWTGDNRFAKWERRILLSLVVRPDTREIVHRPDENHSVSNVASSN